MDKNKDSDMKLGFKKVEEIYNNSIHTCTKVEPFKEFNFTDENDINNDIKKVLKSQTKVYKNFNCIRKGEKCLLNKLL